MGSSNSSITRRSFLKNIGMVGATSAISMPAVAKQKTYRWKMVTTWPKNFPGLGTGANYLAKCIESLSAGQIKVKVYGAGELVPAMGVFDAVSRGTAQLGHGAAYYWQGKHSASPFFAAVPFGLNASELNAWITHGGGQKLWDQLYSDFGVRAYLAGNTGVQMGGWFNKEINSMKDFKGLKMRMPGLGGEVLRKAGATVVNLPGGELFQALKSGAIDATEWVGPYNDLAFGFHKAAKFYYWPGWHEPTAGLECLMNQKAYGELPKHLQESVRIACEAANYNMAAEFSARNSSALNTLVNKHKVQLKKYPDEVLRKLNQISDQVVKEVGNKDPLSKKIYASFDKFKTDSSKFNKIS
jgi:TRAP-type mannitol/chloroaromatic compound transport system substrate-binding protein